MSPFHSILDDLEDRSNITQSPHIGPISHSTMIKSINRQARRSPQVAKSTLKFQNVSVNTGQLLQRTLSTASSQPSAATGNKDGTKASDAVDPHRRICKALYRQLLRWCDDTDQTVPLSKFIPPVHMKPPQIHPVSLRLVAQKDPASPLSRFASTDFFPPNALIKETELTVPLTNSADAKQFFRAIFRMNAYPPPETSPSSTFDSTTLRKEQVSLAFEGLKSLNEVSIQKIKILMDLRAQHWDRTGVNFRVGQVVKHNSQNWRGVVFGWNRVDRKSSTKDQTATSATSLTQKSYQSSNPNDDDLVSYIVALDWGDASIVQQSNRQVQSIMEAKQSELSLVKDPDLLRIRNGQLGEHFGRFDAETRCFVPGEVSSFVYPSDTLDEEWSNYRNPSDATAQEIIDGIQNMAEYLRNIVLGYTSAPESRQLSILSSMLDRISKISAGDVIPGEERFKSNSFMTQSLMRHHLQQFMNLVVELNDTLWTRRASKETDRTIKYSLGQVVRHKKYGFRGVVVAWDAGKDYCHEMCNVIEAFFSQLWQRARLRGDTVGWPTTHRQSRKLSFLPCHS